MPKLTSANGVPATRTAVSPPSPEEEFIRFMSLIPEEIRGNTIFVSTFERLSEWFQQAEDFGYDLINRKILTIAQLREVEARLDDLRIAFINIRTVFKLCDQDNYAKDLFDTMVNKSEIKDNKSMSIPPSVLSPKP